MKILLKPNLDRDRDFRCTKVLVREILRQGGLPMLEDTCRPAMELEGRGCVFGGFPELLRDCDVLMPVGGDGTVMRAAQAAARADKPIVAVNAGRVGFLTQMERHETHLLQRLVEGNYTETRRMMLEARVSQDGETSEILALNDVVVRADMGRLADLSVHETGKLIARHRADGLIFATPTGSTAYSLSAGGPIVDPDLSLMVMTAICSHSPFNCAMVLPSNRVYTVSGKGAALEDGLSIWVDGQRVGKIFDSETLTVRKSETVVRFAELGQRDFYSNVNEKLTWGGN